MSRYGNRGSAPVNPYWSDIDRCYTRLQQMDRDGTDPPITAKAQNLIRDLHRRGESYQMNTAQIRYFTATAQKLYSTV